LGCKEKLDGLEAGLKDEFRDIFKPIPHIDSLPTLETAWIQLIDAYKKISKTVKYVLSYV